MDRGPGGCKGYDKVEREGPQAAHQPRQVVNDVALLAQAVVGVLEQNAEAVQGVSQDDQAKQEVGHPLGGLSLILKNLGGKDMFSLSASTVEASFIS